MREPESHAADGVEGRSCPQCGYDVHGQANYTCPECGRKFFPGELIAARGHRGLMICAVVSGGLIVIGIALTMRIGREYLGSIGLGFGACAVALLGVGLAPAIAYRATRPHAFHLVVLAWLATLVWLQLPWISFCAGEYVSFAVFESQTAGMAPGDPRIAHFGHASLGTINVFALLGSLAALPLWWGFWSSSVRRHRLAAHLPATPLVCGAAAMTCLAAILQVFAGYIVITIGV